jgi:hypothetical protein
LSAPKHALRVVSHLPGRLRVAAEPFRTLPDVADAVVAALEAEPAVKSARASRVTGSVLVLYDADAIDLLRLLRVVMRTSGLTALRADRRDAPAGPRPGDRLRGLLGEIDARARAAAGGKADLRVGVPASLALLGLGRLVAGGARVPEWYDLLFWSFVTFSNLNPPAPRGAEGDGR